jgi:hypothetical protein
MFKRFVNLLKGRTEYRTECVPVAGLGEIIGCIVIGKNSVLEIEGEDDRDFDSRIDFMRELSDKNRYQVKSIWRDSFIGKRDRKVYFDVYACDVVSKRDVLISGSYVIEHKVTKSPRNA